MGVAGLRHGVDDLHRQHQRLLGGRFALQQQQEFVAAQTCRRMRRDQPAQALRNALQQPVAAFVAEVFVDMLEPIFLSYPVPKAVSPRLGLGAQASIRWTMYRTRAIQRSGLVNCGAVT